MSKLFADLKISQKSSDILVLSMSQSHQYQQCPSPALKCRNPNEANRMLVQSPKIMYKNKSTKSMGLMAPLQGISPIKQTKVLKPFPFCEKCHMWEKSVQQCQNTMLSLQRVLIDKEEELFQRFMRLTRALQEKDKLMHENTLKNQSLQNHLQSTIDIERQRAQQQIQQKTQIIRELQNHLRKQTTLLSKLLSETEINPLWRSSDGRNREIIRGTLQQINLLNETYCPRKSFEGLKENTNSAHSSINTFYKTRNLGEQSTFVRIDKNNPAFFANAEPIGIDQVQQWQCVKKLQFQNKNLKAYSQSLEEVLHKKQHKRFNF